MSFFWQNRPTTLTTAGFLFAHVPRLSVRRCSSLMSVFMASRYDDTGAGTAAAVIVQAKPAKSVEKSIMACMIDILRLVTVVGFLKFKLSRRRK